MEKIEEPAEVAPGHPILPETGYFVLAFRGASWHCNYPQNRTFLQKLFEASWLERKASNCKADAP